MAAQKSPRGTGQEATAPDALAVQRRGQPTFESVDDTPLFRAKAAELGAAAERLDKRCGRLVRGARRYRDGVAAVAHAQTEFSETLKEFCVGPDGTGTDEESMSLGSGTISRFIEVFQDLGQASELLKGQVDHILVERLQTTWPKGLLSGAREAAADYAHKADEHDAAQKRFLGHKSLAGKMLSKKTQGETDRQRAQAETIAAGAAAHDARYELARRLTEVEGRKRHDFLEGIVSVMDGHLRFFKAGYEALAELEPYLHQALEAAEGVKEEERQRGVALEDAIYGAQKEHSNREVRRADAVLRASAAPRPAGPLQMTGAAATVKAEVEGHIRATAASKGAQITVLKQGYLLKKSTGIRREWKRRFFVLDSSGMLYYYSNKEKKDHRKTPQNTVALQTATVKPGAEEPADANLQFCFRVVSQERSYVLQATDELEATEWMQCIQAVIAVVLESTRPPLGKIEKRRPATPTHLRAPSGTVPWGSGGASFVAESIAADAGSVRSSAPSETGSAGPDTAMSRDSGVAGEALAAALGAVPGNEACADCGAYGPEWASLNLGVLLCASCSGVHRHLGVHVSKVRSLTLDERVWERSVVALFEGLGNAYANASWEENLLQPRGSPPGVAARVGALSLGRRTGDSEQWPAGAYDHSYASLPNTAPFAPPTPYAGSAPGTPKRTGSWMANASPHASASPRSPQAWPSPGTPPPPGVKPGPEASAAERDAYITAKYVQRLFGPLGSQLPGGSAQAALWEAAENGDVRAALRAFAAGAQVDARYGGPLAGALVAQAHARTPDPKPALPSDSLGDVTALHCAAQVGLVPLLELLLQNGARAGWADAAGRQPLHYAVLAGRTEAAKLMVRRGAPRYTKDASGRSPLDVLLEQPTVADRELLFWLSESEARPNGY